MQLYNTCNVISKYFNLVNVLVYFVAQEDVYEPPIDDAPPRPRDPRDRPCPPVPVGDRAKKKLPSPGFPKVNPDRVPLVPPSSSAGSEVHDKIVIKE